MLKYEHNGLIDRLEMHGNMDDIIAEVTYLIRRAYKVIEKNHPDAAEEFKSMVTKIVGDPESPVWADHNGIAVKLAQKLEEVLEMLKSRNQDKE